MAIIPETQYPGKIAPSTPEYPYGAARNITLPGDGSGTPWDAALVNDLFGFQQALLGSVGYVPSGNPEKVGASQYLDAIVQLLGRKSAFRFETVTDMLANAESRINSNTTRVYVSSGVWRISESSAGLAQVSPIANTSPQLYAAPLNGVWADDFGPIVNNTDCVATINAAMAHFGTLDAAIKVPLVGTINVDSVSVLFERNKRVDLGGNTFKLADGASKYVFSQTDLTTDDFAGSNGGNLEVYNFTLDGNARGGQTRNLTGTDVRDMYCGFGALFFGLRSLKVHDFKCIDTEAWGFAYFKCRDTEWHTGVFDQDETRVGLNGDGITGIGSRTHIWNITGYTNDDLTAMGTTRASIGGVEVWNDGVDIESFNVHDIEMTDKNGKSCHFASGVYPSDGRTVKQWTMSNISGNCENGIWRCGNYFDSLGATDGVIQNVTESNINGYSKIAGQGQRLVFKTTLQTLNIDRARNIVGVLTANNQFIRVDDATINTLMLSDSTYQQLFTPASREGVIHINADSVIKNINVSNFFHSLTGAQLPTPEVFTLVRNYGSRPRMSLSNVTKGDAGNGNLNVSKADYWVSGTGIVAGDLSVCFSESLTLNSANYTEVEDIYADFDNGFVTYRGGLLSDGVSITKPSELNIITKPSWAKPDQNDISSQAIFIKNGGVASPEAANLLFRNATTNIDIYNISGNPLDSYIFLTGIRYKVDPAMP